MLKIDHRNINDKALKNDEVQSYLKRFAEDRIAESDDRRKNENMIKIWQDDIEYIDGTTLPLGYQNDIMQAVGESNLNKVIDTSKFTIRNSVNEKTGQLWIVDNKIKEAFRGLRGDLTTAKKELIVKSDNIMQNNNIEKAFQNFLDQFDDRKQLWTNLWVPFMEGILRYGLYYYKFFYDSYRRALKNGDIMFRLYHPKDVLLDPYSMNSKYHINSRYIIYMDRVELEEAEMEFKPYGIKPEDITADDDYTFEQFWQSDDGNLWGKFCTVFTIEYRKTYINDVELEDRKDENGNPVKIPQKETYYFKMLYNRKMGVFHHEVCEHVDRDLPDQWQFELIPGIYDQSSVRLYDVAMAEELKTIQDVTDITESLIINDFRDKQKVRAYVLKQLSDKFGDVFDTWMAWGGKLEVDNVDEIKNGIGFYKPDGLGDGAYKVLEIMEKAMKEHALNNEILQGSVPNSGDISGPIINGLTDLRQRKFGFIDKNFTWSATQGNIKLYHIVSEKFTQEDFIAINSSNKYDPKYIPICATLTLREFEEFLSRAYPNTDYQAASEMFERNNVVEIYISKYNESGLPVNEDEAKDYRSIVYVNYLTSPKGDKYRFLINVRLSYDFEKNKQQDASIAWKLRESKEIGPRKFFEKMPAPWCDEVDDILKEVEEENKVLQIGNFVEELGPEFEQFVVKAGENYKKKMAELKKNKT